MMNSLGSHCSNKHCCFFFSLFSPLGFPCLSGPRVWRFVCWTHTERWHTRCRH